METELQFVSAIFNNWNIQFHPVTAGIVATFVFVLLLLLSSALISGSEVAYFSLSATDKKKLAHKKTRTNQRVLKNLENPEKLLATILVANNFVNIAIVILSAYITNNLMTIIDSPVLEFALQVVLITFLLLLIGEILPKVYATHYSLRFSRLMALPLLTLEKIFRPINSILIFSTSFVNKRMQKHQKNISMDELSQALELTSEKEISEEKEILEGIVKFGNKNVEDIMKPRVDVTSLNIKASFKEVLDTINESGYSRIPVYIESFDNISGILYIKDLLPHSHKGNTFKWQTLVRAPFYVPETKKINDLLEEFQKNKVHLAIVVDEYGGSSGIVTLEDILEEIVGDITDEFDEEEHFYTRISENQYLFDGKITLGDFHKIIGSNESVFADIKGDADTLAGLILELKGDIPTLHEVITCKQFRFTVESVDRRRVKQIKVEVNK